MAVLGNLLRAAPLQLNELPYHIKFGSSAKQSLDQVAQSPDTLSNSILGHNKTSEAPDQNGRPELTAFIKEILDQATEFIADIVPSTFQEVGLKTSAPSSAQVRHLSRVIPSAQLTQISWTTSKIPRRLPLDNLKSGEVWFARRSLHQNWSHEGTADFVEFDHALRIDHSEHEQEYTPEVIDLYKVIEWDLQDNDSELVIDDYSNIRMNIYEICHKLPSPLSPRVFPELVVTAKTGPLSFIVVQVPINLGSFQEAFYSNGRNIREGDSETKRKKFTQGTYTSIECCRVGEDQNIEWVMALTSDAKGSLPMWVQKLGVPGAIVKDVGRLIKWISQRRGSPAVSN